MPTINVKLPSIFAIDDRDASHTSFASIDGDATDYLDIEYLEDSTSDCYEEIEYLEDDSDVVIPAELKPDPQDMSNLEFNHQTKGLSIQLDVNYHTCTESTGILNVLDNIELTAGKYRFNKLIHFADYLYVEY